MMMSLTFDLFFDRFSRIEPMFDIIRIGELQTEIILFDQIQRIEYLLVQISRNSLFLQSTKR